MASAKKYFWVLIVTFVFILDLVTKTLALNYLVPEEPIRILPILNITLKFNTGAAFSFLNQAGGWQGWLFGMIGIGISIFVIIWLSKLDKNQLWLKIALALILGGTFGNLFDRIFYHKVIDFIDFYFKQWHYATFNIADSAICIGAVMLVIDIMWKDKTNQG